MQFHPEVTHTRQGLALLRRFVVDICGCETLWTAANIVDDLVERVRAQVGSDEVVLGLSGGVDSSVVAALLHRAIGDQLTCVFVDTGLLRWNEGDQVMAMFAEHMGVKVVRVDAHERYFERLAGVGDPEAKRKIIGNLSSTSSTSSRKSSPTRSGSRRARSTRTSSNRPAARPARRT